MFLSVVTPPEVAPVTLDEVKAQSVIEHDLDDVLLKTFIGAATAQFSAAVADTVASGGLVEEASYGAIDHRYVYLAVAALAVVLLWTSHIFSIIAYASRAFAAYYADLTVNVIVQKDD